MSTTPIDAVSLAGLNADPMLPRPYRVQRLRKETPDTFTLDLEPSSAAAAMAFAPGQFNMLYAFGAGEAPVSISGDPAHPATLVHTIREVGAVTRALHQLKPSHTLGVRGPFGVGWPVAEARGADVVIVAGGIGLAPLRPALYHVLAARKQYGKVVLLYGTRTPADILYLRELQQWHSRFDLEVHVTVDRAPGEWHGNVGVVTKLIPRAPFDPQSTVAMLCGPEVMMRFTVQDLERRGVARENIYLSMERNMKCAVGFCGHCQYGPTFICKDGPVFRYDRLAPLLAVREI
ncbi:MAG TPA: FAD/NAD(P)-binding protein [Terriglobia bacterium]|nr:FAD/NAD(P)-binding protein [Terriglobia bacterium]